MGGGGGAVPKPSAQDRDEQGADDDRGGGRCREGRKGVGLEGAESGRGVGALRGENAAEEREGKRKEGAGGGMSCSGRGEGGGEVGRRAGSGSRESTFLHEEEKGTNSEKGKKGGKEEKEGLLGELQRPILYRKMMAQALPLLWPDGWVLRARMLLCVVVLVAARVCNLLVPLCYKVRYSGTIKALTILQYTTYTNICSSLCI
jgi:hypothetical protein